MSKTTQDSKGVKVLGQVKNGKLVVDAETLKRIGGGNGLDDAFRPVNAPFDSRPLEEAA